MRGGEVSENEEKKVFSGGASDSGPVIGNGTGVWP